MTRTAVARRRLSSGVLAAGLAAVLFGASTPAAKVLVGGIPPILLAGLLYAGAGIGLAIAIALRALFFTRQRQAVMLPSRQDVPWLLAAVLIGGIVGPVLLMIGLTSTTAASAALLLNLEGVFTALVAWFVFREHFDRRIVIGMVLIVAGGIVLSYEPGSSYAGLSPGAMAVAGACVCWALDNNLTRKISANDAMLIACVKGLASALVNLSIAFMLGQAVPDAAHLAAAGAVGFLGYGVSLALFIYALRQLGTARASAYFSSAPFFGVLLAVVLLAEPLTAALILAGVLMAIGVWLHLSERHSHEHEHRSVEHTHPHVHDAHHQHEHDFDWDGTEPHTHPHRHRRLRHSHPHYPDLHHRHEH
ncbi:MAG: EamA family transporter [Burkholderiales bacterium]